ncbi:MAG: hypothetical protein LBV41_12150 [Cytophagaceae bacterium]|jgi:hypothetical protein|nr:hypothetical protein [Cytophagaceae bacterium]
METTLAAINKVLARYRIKPFTREEVQACRASLPPIMNEAEAQESLRRLWEKIAEQEVAELRHVY